MGHVNADVRDTSKTIIIILISDFVSSINYLSFANNM